MEFYKRLIAETEQNKAYFLSAPIIQQVLDGDFTLETYICFLNQAFHHVKHTIPLLMLAGGRLSDQQGWLRKTISNYIEEEIGHEQWILDDIAACGYDRSYYETAPAPYHSEIMVSFLYDFVARQNPVGIFGMVLVLEGTSAGLAPVVASLVQKQLALPDAAMTYLTTHGELDQGHIQFFEKAMNKITDLDDQAAIIHVANTMYRLYGDVYRSIPNAALLLQNTQAA